MNCRHHLLAKMMLVILLISVTRHGVRSQGEVIANEPKMIVRRDEVLALMTLYGMHAVGNGYSI